MDITANISRNTVQKHVDFVNETSNPFHTSFIPKVNMKPIHSKLMTTSESFHYYFSMFSQMSFYLPNNYLRIIKTFI